MISALYFYYTRQKDLSVIEYTGQLWCPTGRRFTDLTSPKTQLSYRMHERNGYSNNPIPVGNAYIIKCHLHNEGCELIYRTLCLLFWLWIMRHCDSANFSCYLPTWNASYPLLAFLRLFHQKWFQKSVMSFNVPEIFLLDMRPIYPNSRCASSNYLFETLQQIRSSCTVLWLSLFF